MHGRAGHGGPHARLVYSDPDSPSVDAGARDPVPRALDIALPFSQDAAGLHVTLPTSQPATAVAYALKLTKSGTAPPTTMAAGVQ